MGLKFCAISSGSKGNCTYISDGTTDVLIDLGISATRAERCLSVLGVDPDKVSVLVTHSHSDHVGGLRIFCKKHPSTRVICQKECASGIMRSGGVSPMTVARNFTLGTLFVTALAVSHDVPCFGYIVSDGEKKIAVVTDIGVVDGKQLQALGDCGIVMLECNHDPDMLRANPRYTPMLKARIASSHGHLSNADCAAACTYLASGGVKNFVLAHLSEENNDPVLAVRQVCRAIGEAGVYDAHVIAAKQNAMSGLFEVC